MSHPLQQVWDTSHAGCPLWWELKACQTSWSGYYIQYRPQLVDPATALASTGLHCMQCLFRHLCHYVWFVSWASQSGCCTCRILHVAGERGPWAWWASPMLFIWPIDGSHATHPAHVAIWVWPSCSNRFINVQIAFSTHTDTVFPYHFLPLKIKKKWLDMNFPPILITVLKAKENITLIFKD